MWTISVNPHSCVKGNLSPKYYNYLIVKELIIINLFTALLLEFITKFILKSALNHHNIKTSISNKKCAKFVPVSIKV